MDDNYHLFKDTSNRFDCILYCSSAYAIRSQFEWKQFYIDRIVNVDVFGCSFEGFLRWFDIVHTCCLQILLAYSKNIAIIYINFVVVAAAYVMFSINKKSETHKSLNFNWNSVCGHRFCKSIWIKLCISIDFLFRFKNSITYDVLVAFLFKHCHQLWSTYMNHS